MSDVSLRCRVAALTHDLSDETLAVEDRDEVAVGASGLIVGWLDRVHPDWPGQRSLLGIVSLDDGRLVAVSIRALTVTGGREPLSRQIADGIRRAQGV